MNPYLFTPYGHNIDHLLLLIDNDAKALAWMLAIVRQSIRLDWTDKPDLTLDHCNNLAGNIELAAKYSLPTRIANDTQDEYRRQLLTISKWERQYFNTKGKYWEWVAKHYLGKHNEGCRMENYLA